MAARKTGSHSFLFGSILRHEFGFPFIFISHDLSVVNFMSDKMNLMKKGTIIEYGDSDEIYSNSGIKYTRSLIDDIRKAL